MLFQFITRFVIGLKARVARGEHLSSGFVTRLVVRDRAKLGGKRLWSLLRKFSGASAGTSVIVRENKKSRIYVTRLGFLPSCDTFLGLIHEMKF